MNEMKDASLFVIETVTMIDKNDGNIIRTSHVREFKDHKSVVNYMDRRMNDLENKGYEGVFTDDGRVIFTKAAIGQTRVLSVCKQQFFASIREPTESLKALIKKASGDSYNFT